MFLTMLANKLKARNGEYIEINTYKVKASQYNHLNHEYNKKRLSQRWNEFEHNSKNIKIQRDMYSAYLIKNVINKDTVNDEQCNKDFNIFIGLHNMEIERLKGLNNISSMGI